MARGTRNAVSIVVVVLASLLTSSFVTPKANAYPTRAKAEESIEESIGRLQYDEARGKKMIAANEKKIEKLVGAKIYAALKNGSCSQLACAKGAAGQKARGLFKENLRISRQLAGVVQEKQTLMAMVQKLNRPLAANTLSQPGVSRVPATVAAPSPSSGVPVGTTSPTTIVNPLMPADPTAKPAAAPQQAPAGAPEPQRPTTPGS